MTFGNVPYFDITGIYKIYLTTNKYFILLSFFKKLKNFFHQRSQNGCNFDKIVYNVVDSEKYRSLVFAYVLLACMLAEMCQRSYTCQY